MCQINFNLNEEENTNLSDEITRIKEMGSARVETARGSIHCLTVIGQIEGHTLLPPQNKTTKYEHVIPQLVSIVISQPSVSSRLPSLPVNCPVATVFTSAGTLAMKWPEMVLKSGSPT